MTELERQQAEREAAQQAKLFLFTNRLPTLAATALFPAPVVSSCFPLVSSFLFFILLLLFAFLAVSLCFPVLPTTSFFVGGGLVGGLSILIGQ